jgi:hypothetical protein
VDAGETPRPNRPTKRHSMSISSRNIATDIARRKRPWCWRGQSDRDDGLNADWFAMTRKQS